MLFPGLGLMNPVVTILRAIIEALKGGNLASAHNLLDHYRGPAFANSCHADMAYSAICSTHCVLRSCSHEINDNHVILQDRLDDIYVHIAQLLEKEGDLAGAEHHLVQGGSWREAVDMHANSGAWEEALRVARQHGGISAHNKVHLNSLRRDEWLHYKHFTTHLCKHKQLCPYSA